MRLALPFAVLAVAAVLLSDTIAMSDYVRKYRCGVAIRHMDIESLACAIGILMRDYDELSSNARRIDPAEFSIETMIENHRRVYGL